MGKLVLFLLISLQSFAVCPPGIVTTTADRYLQDYAALCEEELKKNNSLGQDFTENAKNVLRRAIMSCAGSVRDMAASLVNIPVNWMEEQQEVACRSFLDSYDYVEVLKEYYSPLWGENYRAQIRDFKGCRSQIEIDKEKRAAFFKALETLHQVLFEEARLLFCMPEEQVAKIVCPIITGEVIVKAATLTKADILEAFQKRGIHITYMRNQKTIMAAGDYEIVSGEMGGDTVYKAIHRTTRKEVMVKIENGVMYNSDETRKILQSIIGASPSGGNQTVMAVVDINNLGKVNYFREGYTAGDKYIEAVRQAIQRNIGSDALVVRSQGDEFYIVWRNISPEQAQARLQAISATVRSDPELARVFSGNSQNLSPGVSIGSTTTTSGDTTANAVERASRQLGETRRVYYEQTGQDATKYGGGPARNRAHNPQGAPPRSVPPPPVPRPVRAQ